MYGTARANDGYRARIGLIFPSVNTVIESWMPKVGDRVANWRGRAGRVVATWKNAWKQDLVQVKFDDGGDGTGTGDFWTPGVDPQGGPISRDTRSSPVPEPDGSKDKADIMDFTRL